MSGSADLEKLFGAFADAIADRVVDRLRSAERPDWIEPGNSPLGRKKHCAAVRRRCARGLPGACVIGRRHLLSREALAEELAMLTKGRPTKRSPERELADELGIEVGTH